MDKKIIINNLKNIALFTLLISIRLLAVEDIGFKGELQDSIFTAWGYIKTGIQVGLFIWFVVIIVQAVMGRDKEGAWWKAIGIIAVIAFLQIATTLWNSIAGTTFTTESE